ncbi:gp36 hinge connector of long tail fiber distal connector [Delftia phage PhiW-14]|uniref:Gp36 hinge connector of long tail fiber distal connector n=1 Tax=Delftia phage PhiW-14 TaxID=665032 RepID=C9DG34_BPW14|nr:gp36 hinge connector of long tail fiber distal connector [Delftia phage PhiW-14]ACV50085.1 gp36 hinge connector of long tail fiber distal connector [Delftia phage PhiW-14]
MADFPQRMFLPQDLDVKHVGKLESLDFNNGFTIKGTAAPTVYTPPSIGEQRVVFATADRFNGMLHINMTSGASEVSITLSVQAKRNTGNFMRTSIEILGFSSTDNVNMNLVTFELHQNSSDQRVAVVGVFKFNSVLAFDVNVGATGTNIDFPIGSLNASEFTQNIQHPLLQKFDLRDVSYNRPSRSAVAGGTYNLNAENVPGSISCTVANPASPGTFPAESSANGVCLVMRGTGSDLVQQMWVGADDNPWFRLSVNGGTSWTAWNMVYTRKNTQEIYDAASSQALIWAIVMG